MKNISSHANNENGFVLVTALLMLMVLLVIGVAATNTSIIELQISGNDKQAKILFYKAESAAMENAQRLQNESNTDNLRPSRSDKNGLFDKNDKTQFLTDGTKWSDSKVLKSALDSNVSMVAIAMGRVKGKKASSLKMTSSAVYAYQLLGRAVKNNSQKIIEIGYKKRF